MTRSFRYTNLLLLLVLVSACMRFDSLSYEMRENQIVFITPMTTGGQTYLIQDFTIVKKNCQQECTWWSIKQDNNNPSASFRGNELIYGATPIGMTTISMAKELDSGQYDAGGTAYIVETGKPERPRIISLELELIVDEQDRIEVIQSEK